MKKLKFIIGLFIFGLFLFPSMDVNAATEVSDEASLRSAIEKGGDITLTQNIEVTKPLVVDKDVNISRGKGSYILMQGDNTLLTVNSGNVTLDGILLGVGLNSDLSNYVKNQGKVLVINGGTVNFNASFLYAGNVGIELNGGSVMGNLVIYVGESNDNNIYSGGKAMIVNGGNIDCREIKLYSGGNALTINKGANINLHNRFDLKSYEANGIEINDGSVVNIQSDSEGSNIFGVHNAIYLNGGTINLNGQINLRSSNTGKGIYINKGINTSTKGDVLNLKNDFVFSYVVTSTSNFSMYVNPEITELRLTDEKEFLELTNNKLNLGFCGNPWEPSSQTDEDKKAICTNLGTNYDGPIETNELKSCTVVYINGEKSIVDEENCKTDEESVETPSQVVSVPPTAASSILYTVVGLVIVIIASFVIYVVVSKRKAKE